tara:strand:+ start:151 stop:288 length:138 start_codon:yes stop_codon:yes gene_type:complete
VVVEVVLTMVEEAVPEGIVLINLVKLQEETLPLRVVYLYQKEPKL